MTTPHLITGIVIGGAILAFALPVCIGAFYATRSPNDDRHKWTPCSWCGGWYNAQGQMRKSAPLIADEPLSHGICAKCADEVVNGLYKHRPDKACAMDLNERIKL